MKAKKNAISLKQKIAIGSIFGILLAAVVIFLIIQRVDVKVLGFRTEVEETAVAEIGIQYQIPSGKAKNGLEEVKPTVSVTLDGKDIPIENLRFTPEKMADYHISYVYELLEGEKKELITVLTVKDTQKPSIIGADTIDSKVCDGEVVDFSDIIVVDRSGEDIDLQTSVYKSADEKKEKPLKISGQKITLSAANKGYTVVLSAEDSSGNKAEIVKDIEFAEKGEFEFANNEEYVKKYAYGSHGASVSYNSKPEYIFDGTGSIKYELTSDLPWPCLRLKKPFITDLTGSYGLSFWVYNDSDYWAPLAFCQKFTVDTKCAPHSWTNIVVTTEQMKELLPKKKDKNLPVGILTDMTDFDLMYNNVDTKYNMTLYFDTFEVLYQKPKYSIALDKDVKTVKTGQNIELSTPTVVGFEQSGLEVKVIDSQGNVATEVIYKNGKYIAKELSVGMYTVCYFYKDGRYGCTANQRLQVTTEDEYETLKRYVSDSGTIEIEKSTTHGNDGSYAAKYTNGQWMRWSFISMDDSDLSAITEKDSIEFWLMYKQKVTSDFNRLTVRLLTESDESVQLSEEIQLVEGKWVKISLNAEQMRKYLKAKDGLRLRVTIPEDTGENDLSYEMYFDDFKVVKGGNKLDIEATKRYSSENGTFSASKDIVHGKDKSITAKYTNGQWMRWSFISIDDSDVGTVTEKDSIEFWLMYKKKATSDFNRLTARLLTESDESVQLSEELKLVEGKWTKISLNAEQMRKYLKAKDGLRLRLTIPEDTGENDLSYDLYLDDFKVVKGGNTLDVQATKRYSSENGTFSASKDIVHGKDKSIAAKYTNGQWMRWSFISIDDSDVGTVTEKDSIEFWLMYKKKATSDSNRLTARLITESNESVQLSEELKLVEGKWTKISLNAEQMRKYLKAKDGLRLRLTVPEDTGENDFSYDMYIDDFKVVKGGNKLDVEATKRYSSTNGTLSASQKIAHGTDGSIAAKYTNGAWMRWSFISIEDSDIQPVTVADTIEMWVRYERLANADFDDLEVYMVTESDYNTVISEKVTLVEDKWAKVTISGSYVQTYIDKADGMRLQITTNGGQDGYANYHLYIDDFKVVRNGNKDFLEATKRYSSTNGTLSASEDWAHGTDGSLAAKYVNGEWGRWSFINIDDSDIQPVNAADTIEMWVRYERVENSGFDDLEVYMVTENDYNTVVSEKVALVEGEWAKVSISGSHMKTYLDKADGMRLQITAVGGEDHLLSYALYIDDFKIVRNTTDVDDDAEATSRYTSSNGDISASKTIVHGEDGSIATKYANGQWGRWSFINIDDSDIQPVNAVDTIEMWVRYERIAASDFDDIEVYMVTENDHNTVISDRVILVEGEWAKVTMSGANMKTYLDKADGMRLQATAIGGTGEALWYNLYIDDFRIIRGEEEVIGDPVRGYSSAKGTLEEVTGPVHERTDKYFTKFVSDAGVRQSVIYIDDTLFRSGLTKKDSIRFYAYLKKDTEFNAETVSISLAGNGSKEIPFGEWTLVTLNGEEMQKYLSEENSLKLTATAGPDEQGTNFGYTMYLTDVEVLKLANADVTTDMLTVTGGNGTVEAGVQNHGLYSGSYATFVNGTWDWYPRIKIDDSQIKEVIEDGDTLEFWVYMEHNNGGANGQAPFWLSTANDDTQIGGRTTMVQNGQVWTKITLDAEGVRKYLKAKDGLKICINMEEDFPAFKLTIGELAVVKNVLAQDYISTDGSITRVGGPIHEKAEAVFTKYVNKESARTSFITINEQVWPAEITKKDSIRFYAFAEKATGFDAETLSLALVDNEGHSVVIKDGMTIPFGEWTMITLNRAEVQKYLDAKKGIGIQLTAGPAEQGSNFGYILYLTDVEVLKLANADVTTDMLTVTGGNGTVEAGVQNHGLYSGSYATFVNGMWDWYPRIKIDDSQIKEVIEDGDTLEFWAYMEHNNGGADGQAPVWLSTVNDDTQIGGRTTMVQNGQVWTKITLDAEGVRKYLAANDGLKICINMEEDFPAFKLTIGELAVVKK